MSFSSFLARSTAAGSWDKNNQEYMVSAGLMRHLFPRSVESSGPNFTSVFECPQNGEGCYGVSIIS